MYHPLSPGVGYESEATPRKKLRHKERQKWFYGNYSTKQIYIVMFTKMKERTGIINKNN